MTAPSLLRLLSLTLVLSAALTAWAPAQQAPPTREALVAAAERAPGPVKGRAEAPITIVEVSDFQCTDCRKFWHETLPKLEAARLPSDIAARAGARLGEPRLRRIDHARRALRPADRWSHSRVPPRHGA